MATRIKILPENLTNKIAAGEVVERPASVVKELVENALDAGSAEIVVEIEAGGKRLIKVTDTGGGMSREDALLALERHATSKISSDADLFTLSTLGFRGEALPSIASVSRFTLASRESGRIEGTEIYLEGGRVKEVKACGMAEGTVISVRSLFFNTPVRLKFMKSNETEAGHVGDLLTRLAISRPDVRFTYINDGRTVFRALDGELKDRLAALLGKPLTAELYPLAAGNDLLKITGFLARPECSRSSSTNLYTYINGRFIRDKVVQHAVLQAYRNFMERGRFPVAVLFLTIPPGEVDVNVHPTKHEVRFREQGVVHDLIQAGVEQLLRGTPWLKQQLRMAAPLTQRQPEKGPSDIRVAEVRELLAHYSPMLSPRIPPPTYYPQVSTPTDAIVTEAYDRNQGAQTSGYFCSLTLIGQYNAAYILCQDGPDLVLIDQHAAHERVAFERLKAQFAAGDVESQGLLFAESLDFSFRESATISENLGGLVRIGFALEEFGGTTWLLKGVPRFLADRDYLRTLRDILEELKSLGRSRSFADIQEEILTRIACHSVVRGSRLLTTQEIAALFIQMDATDFASNCPHGRPVMQKLTLGEIERMFKRL